MTIALASDHAGFEQLKDLQSYLESIGHKCHNFGPTSLRPDDDYPDFVFPAARVVASGGCDRGIIMGRSGEGEAMAANRIKGVRCGVFYGPSVARRAVDARGKTSRDPYEIIRLVRQHNDSNMLSLAASFVSLEDIKGAVKLWLDTPFSGDERHERRNKKLDEV
ncbi:RpiB/LacA/LacB family sugar-phosphate isomerase [Candidatus Saccharibacteria bacterium]|nr:RpiB/LacA/LacB family sugar-phosphate isomerase [Candidatus Saccharibacteria bacterium]